MKTAIFTIVKNEKFFIKLWYDYYSKHFNPSDIYILNHETNDGSLDVLKYTGCKILNVYNDVAFDHNWLLNTVKNFQVELLKKYDVVCFAESDEFIVPLNTTLKDYVSNFNDDYVTCKGIELLHGDVDYSPEKLVLEQKTKYVVSSDFWCKTLISKVPLNWEHGFHRVIDRPNKKDENLLCIHLHWFDYNIFVNRSLERITWSDKFEAGDMGIQNKHTDITKAINEFNSFQENKIYADLNIPKVF